MDREDTALVMKVLAWLLTGRHDDPDDLRQKLLDRAAQFEAPSPN